jgi:DNA-binding NarL/FixJ family response regulator
MIRKPCGVVSVLLLRVEQDFPVICEAANGLEAIQRARAQGMQPDVVILGIGRPGISGIEAAPEIGRVAPRARILFLSQHNSRHMMPATLQAGGRGYVVKSDAARELISAVRAVHDGKVFLSAELSQEESEPI